MEETRKDTRWEHGDYERSRIYVKPTAHPIAKGTVMTGQSRTMRRLLLLLSDEHGDQGRAWHLISYFSKISIT